MHPAVQGHPLRMASAFSQVPFAPVKSLGRAMRKPCVVKNSSCAELWAQLTSKLHGLGCHVELAFFFYLAECSSEQGWVSAPIVSWRRKLGGCSWESGNGLNLHMLVKGFTCVPRAEASLFLVLRGVCLMEDMLQFVSQLLMAQKKMSVCFLGLWLIQHFFT